MGIGASRTLPQAHGPVRAENVDDETRYRKNGSASVRGNQNCSKDPRHDCGHGGERETEGDPVAAFLRDSSHAVRISEWRERSPEESRKIL